MQVLVGSTRNWSYPNRKQAVMGQQPSVAGQGAEGRADATKPADEMTVGVRRGFKDRGEVFRGQKERIVAAHEISRTCESLPLPNSNMDPVVRRMLDMGIVV